MAINSETALKMLTEGHTQELAAMYRDDIYQSQLSKSGGADAKKRYAAMKRFYKFTDSHNMKSLEAPGAGIEWGNETVNAFVDGHGFVVTTESIGQITPFQGEEFLRIGGYHIGDYEFYGAEELPARDIIARAKALGYKANRDEVTDRPCFYFRSHGYDWKVSQLDRYFAVIDNGNDPTVVYRDRAMYIHTEIGTAMLLPLPMADWRTTHEEIHIITSDENTAPYEKGGWRRVSEQEAFDFYRGGGDGTLPNKEIYVTADRLTPETWGGRHDGKYEKAWIYDGDKFDVHQRRARQFLDERNGYYLAYYVQM